MLHFISTQLYCLIKAHSSSHSVWICDHACIFHYSTTNTFEAIWITATVSPTCVDCKFTHRPERRYMMVQDLKWVGRGKRWSDTNTWSWTSVWKSWREYCILHLNGANLVGFFFKYSRCFCLYWKRKLQSSAESQYHCRWMVGLTVEGICLTATHDNYQLLSPWTSRWSW